jgi:DNA-binding transcriptional LysR family regulator
MAAAGVGAALVPRLTIDPADRRTVAIDIGDLFPPRRLGIVWHSDRTLSAAAQTFIELARAACADYATAASLEGTWRERTSPR